MGGSRKKHHITKYVFLYNIFSVIPETAHAAFYKACEYFKIEVRTAKINQTTFAVDVKDLISKINCNTVCIVGSIPNFPYGTVDPIEELATIAKRK